MKLTTFLLLIFFVVGCNTKHDDESRQSFLDDCKVVATIEVINGDSVIVCDYNKLKQRKNVPLDELLTDLTILQMDNENDDGLIGRRLVRNIIGEEYIIIFTSGSIPVKLYSKKGKYIRDIGRFGQGPGEYIAVDNVSIDEKNNRIYVLPFSTDRVLVYDFEGNFHAPIPLSEEINYGNTIIVDPDKQELIVTKSPRVGGKHVVWIQDFEGNVIQGVKQSDYFSEDTRSSESTITRLQTPNIEFFSLNEYNVDQYLYHYNVEENRLVPKFRMKNMEEHWIFIYELPRHFVVEVATSTSSGVDGYSTPKIIIEKHSLKGCYFDGFVMSEGIVLDHYDLLFNTYYGYFGLVDFGSNLMDKIEKVNREKLLPKHRQELEKMQQLIEETDLDDDCSLLLYGEFKQ